MENEEIKTLHDEDVVATAELIMDRFDDAFKELAK